MLPGLDGWNTHVCQHRSLPVRRTPRIQQKLWPTCLPQCRETCARPASVASGSYGLEDYKLKRDSFDISSAFLQQQSMCLPCWNVSNYLNVIQGVQGGGVGHAGGNNHLKSGPQNHEQPLVQTVLYTWNTSIQPTDRKDLHRDRGTQTLPEAHVYLLHWDQDSQTHQGDEQLSHVGVRQVLHHRRQRLDTRVTERWAKRH